MNTSKTILLLISYKVEYGRHGYVSGLFVCTQQELELLHETTIYFGEILGKHSSIEITFDISDFKVVSNDQTYIEKTLNIFGKNTLSGYNPLEYMEE